MDQYIGIDVSKSTLQIYIPINQEEIEISNTPDGIKGLFSKLKKRYKKAFAELVFVFEPTGSYSFLLQKQCAQKGVKAFIVNPRHSANFAKALGQRNKTDKADARMLHQMHRMADPDDIAIPVLDEQTNAIKELMGYYKLLQKQRIALSNHLEAAEAKGVDRFVIKDNRLEFKRLKEKEKKVLEEIQRRIEESETLSSHYTHILSTPGIGPVAAIALLQLFITYPDANRKQITALAGLDVVVGESGSSVRKKPHISKRGSKMYRRILFMAAMSATRHNPELALFYERLKAAGKQSTVAQTAVMRKLVVIAHALFKKECSYDAGVYRKMAGINSGENVA